MENKRYVVSYTEMEDGIVVNAGSFDYAFKTSQMASKAMVEDFEQKRDGLKEETDYADKFDASVTEDEIGGEELPVLCVIRDWNGTDYNVYTWTVWPVNL